MNTPSSATVAVLDTSAALETVSSPSTPGRAPFPKLLTEESYSLVSRRIRCYIGAMIRVSCNNIEALQESHAINDGSAEALKNILKHDSWTQFEVLDNQLRKMILWPNNKPEIPVPASTLS